MCNFVLKWNGRTRIYTRHLIYLYMVWLMTLPMVSAAERFIPSVAWV